MHLPATRIAALLSPVVLVAGSARAELPVSRALEQVVTAPAPGERSETLIEGSVEHGGYGGPRVSFGRVAGHDAVHVGGEGGWIVNHRFILGGAGYGLVTDQPAPGALSATDDLKMGYGGVLVGYTLLPQRVLHATFTALVGAGGLTTENRTSHSGSDHSDSFFVLEPAATIELNVVQHFHAGIALSYRWVRGVETDGLSNSDLSGLFGSMVLKFGKF